MYSLDLTLNHEYAAPRVNINKSVADLAVINYIQND